MLGLKLELCLEATVTATPPSTMVAVEEYRRHVLLSPVSLTLLLLTLTIPLILKTFTL